MPELPEVETTCRGIRPHVEGRLIQSVDVRCRQLRWPVPVQVDGLTGKRITRVTRRAKYILLDLDNGGTLIVHLGMSGSLRICNKAVSLRKHDHVVVELQDGNELRYHDPRRFGCWLWTDSDPAAHPLLVDLGPEPLSSDFNGPYLADVCKKRSAAIKQVIMDAHTVVGVGNIYACEALFAAGIHPRRKAARISSMRLDKLVDCIQQVLKKSIDQGGTTLRDFLREDGQPGYFKQQLAVYDREGEACVKCGIPVRRIVLGQRSTYFCSKCQR
jgi:formamidopyrimidine-DNA glycosylase